MDKGEKYVKMCGESKDIQDLWDYKAGDVYFSTYIRPHIYMLKQDGAPENDVVLGSMARGVWLPRQDQLQDMLWNPLSSKYQYKTDLIVFLVNYMQDNQEFPREPGKIKRLYPEDSMEQLWLAFVMKEKFNKTWDSEKEEWIVNTK